MPKHNTKDKNQMKILRNVDGSQCFGTTKKSDSANNLSTKELVQLLLQDS